MIDGMQSCLVHCRRTSLGAWLLSGGSLAIWGAGVGIVGLVDLMVRGALDWTNQSSPIAIAAYWAMLGGWFVGTICALVAWRLGHRFHVLRMTGDGCPLCNYPVRQGCKCPECGRPTDTAAIEASSEHAQCLLGVDRAVGRAAACGSAAVFAVGLVLLLGHAGIQSGWEWGPLMILGLLSGSVSLTVFFTFIRRCQLVRLPTRDYIGFD